MDARRLVVTEGEPLVYCLTLLVQRRSSSTRRRHFHTLAKPVGASLMRLDTGGAEARIEFPTAAICQLSYRQARIALPIAALDNCSSNFQLLSSSHISKRVSNPQLLQHSPLRDSRASFKVCIRACIFRPKIITPFGLAATCTVCMCISLRTWTARHAPEHDYIQHTPKHTLIARSRDRIHIFTHTHMYDTARNDAM